MSRDTSPLVFGKYKGKTPEQVAEIDPSYVVWMYETVKPAPCSTALYDACRMDIDEGDAEFYLTYYDTFFD